MKIRKLLAAFLMIPCLAACSGQNQQQLSLLTPQSSASQSAGSGLPSLANSGSSGAKGRNSSSGVSGSRNNLPGSAESGDSSENPTGSGGHSGTPDSSAVPSNRESDPASSGQGTDTVPSDPGTEPEEPLDTAGAIQIYAAASQKMSALSGLSYSYRNTAVQDGAVAIHYGSVQYRSKSTGAQFLTVICNNNSPDSEIDYYCSGSTLYEYRRSTEEKSVESFDKGFLGRYLMIVDPQFTPEEIRSYAYSRSGGDEILNFKTKALPEDSVLEEIFGCGAAISEAELTYTVNPDGYLTDSKEIFTMQSGARLELDKTYLSPGANVSFARPPWTLTIS